MIASPLRIKIAAAVLAIAAHGAVALIIGGQGAVETEGATGGAQVRLGTSFADMAAGLLAPVAQELPEATKVKDVIAAAQPAPLSAALPVAQVAPPKVAPKVLPSAVSSAVPNAVHVPLTQAVEPAKAAQVVSEDAASNVPPKTLPKPRPPRPEKTRPEPQQQATKAQPKTQPKAQPKGNAQSSATKGQTTGQANAKATSQGASATSKAAGNAAISNYPGKVMRRISRLRRPNVRATGNARVSFQIASNGALASVTLAQSSGSRELDQAALGLVRKAAPFPAPPPGAQRNFSISIKGR